MKYVLASYLISAIIRFWYLFIRVEESFDPESEKIFNEKKPFILNGWHSLILTIVYPATKTLVKKKKRPLAPLVSFSKDGELINQTFLRFNMESVRGSSSKGGAGALKAILKKIKAGIAPVFTPDGPRGPIFKVQPGVVQIASITQLPIITYYTTCDRYYEARSWDKHRFPKFGARQLVNFAKPFYVPKDLNDDEIQNYVKLLEDKMIEQKDQIDEIVKKFSKKGKTNEIQNS